MNQMNELEKRLRSWLPRRPSPKLEQKLFGRRHAQIALLAAPAAGGGSAVAHHFDLSWLAPATLAVMLMCLMLNQRSLSAFNSGSAPHAMMAVALSNQSAAAWLPGSFPHDQNTIPAETFEWTNGSRSNSSLDVIEPRKEND
jgi:hypothetical protein